MGIGVVGCGDIGSRHVYLFNSIEVVSVKGVCDIDVETSELIATILGSKACTNVEDMVLDESIDGISVAISAPPTPTAHDPRPPALGVWESVPIIRGTMIALILISKRQQYLMANIMF